MEKPRSAGTDSTPEETASADPTDISKYLSCGHTGMIFFVKVFLEFLRKTDGTAGNTLDIMINPQVIHLFLGERVGMSLAHGDPIFSRIQLTTKLTSVVSTKRGLRPKLLSTGQGALNSRGPFSWVQFTTH